METGSFAAMRTAQAAPSGAAMLALASALVLASPALAQSYEETPFFAERVAKKELPPIGERLPATPIVVDLAAKRRSIGTHGGDVVSLVSRARDIRYLSANAYARLVGYNERLELQPDLLERVDVTDACLFTLTVCEGHCWSDGQPFTSDDFRYFCEDIA